MRNSLVLGSSLLATLAFASTAHAATWYVSPTGTATCGCATREAPCSLGSAASGAVAGDTVILMDGVYKTQLYVTNSGTSSAWITFKADDCATPIIEGPGVGPAEDNQDSGVSSVTATYLRFDGIVSRGWSTGFGNGWTGTKTPDSNGNWDIQNCIGDMNGRTGFTFFSAQGLTLRHSIAAHNGSSTAHSWSSGVTLYASPGGDIIDSNVSFENMDAEKHTDGSGFIADESSHGATFSNNLAFGNGGSCLRLTKTNSTKFVNNTCYHDAQDSADTGPDDPDEVYFTNAPSDMTTITSISFVNNVLVALGSGHGLKASNYTPTSGWSNNVTATGSVTYFTGAEGNNPDFTLASGASTLIGKGTSSGAPATDLGLDPKCIVKRTPTMIGMMAKASWWQYSIDYDYIKSIGGVAKCFNPKARSGTPDIGSYANGAVTTAMANTCTPATTGGSGMGSVCMAQAGMGGMGAGGTGSGDAGSGTTAGGAGGTTSTGGTGNAAGGMTAAGGSGGSAGAVATGGTSMTGAGGTGTGGTGTATGGTGGSVSAGGSAGGGTTGSGGTGTGTGGASSGAAPTTGGSDTGAAGGAGGSSPGGCGCRVAPDASRSPSFAGFGLFALALFAWRRRRHTH